MARVRVLGPRRRLVDTLEVLLDVGLMHLAHVDRDGPELRPLESSRMTLRHRRYLTDAVADADRALAALALTPAQTGRSEPSPGSVAWPRDVHTTRRIRVEAEALADRRRDLERERVRLARFVRFADAFEMLLPPSERLGPVDAYPVVVAGRDVSALRRRGTEVFGDAFALRATTLDTGEVAAVLLVSSGHAPEMNALLDRAGIADLRLPDGYADRSLRDALPSISTRIGEIDRELADVTAQLERLARREGHALLNVKGACVDRLRRFDAAALASETTRLFVLEGWAPEHLIAQLDLTLTERLGGTVVLERLGVEPWRGDEAPVVLENPAVLRPFETITRLVPLPRYGTIDPTPFVAAFFPMFFGLILGDIGYGVTLLLIATILRRRSKPDATLRSVAHVGIACGVFSILFGFAFGELFGDLGHRVFGMRPLAFARDEELLPFLGLTVALGFVHVLLGLVLGFVGGLRGDRRRSVGRGVAIVMVLLVGVAMLIPLRVLPQALFTPLVVAILIAFPVLIAIEGVIAPIELLSTFSHMLSYARIMALGTASVMMAVVANRLAGAMGSIVVGTLFALLFHLVNFMLGVFAPTIHSLRLHYVEFFGTFVNPGGVRYEPLRRWTPGEEAAR